VGRTYVRAGDTSFVVFDSFCYAFPYRDGDCEEGRACPHESEDWRSGAGLDEESRSGDESNDGGGCEGNHFDFDSLLFLEGGLKNPWVVRGYCNRSYSKELVGQYQNTMRAEFCLKKINDSVDEM
jgi:hypothetical protein